MTTTYSETMVYGNQKYFDYAYRCYQKH